MILQTWLTTWQSALFASWYQVSTAFLLFIPKFIGSAVVFVLGMVIASWGKRITEEVLRVARLEDISKSSGFSGYLQRAHINMSATELLGGLVKWLLLMVFFIASVEILGLTIVSNVLQKLLAYIPNVFAAALIFGAGFIIANLSDGLVRGAFATIDHEAARPVGKLARGVVIVVAFFAALGQLQIAEELINNFFQGLTWTLVLIFGLSIGLGGKDLVAKILEDWYKRVGK